MTPFDCFPPRMLIEMVFLNVFWLNAFPHKLGVSQTLSRLRTIVTGQTVDYNKHCRIEYGQYVQTHEKHNNWMTPRTIGALALCPTGNLQGGYYFYSLMSGQRLHRTHWTELPMPDEVRDRVHALARRANANRGLVFTDSQGNNLDTLFPDDDRDADSNYDPTQDDGASYASSKDSDYNPSATSSQATDADDADNYPDLAEPQPVELAGVDDGITNPIAAPEAETPGVDTTGVDTPGVHAPEEETPGVDLEIYVNELEAELDEEIAALDNDNDPNDSIDDQQTDETCAVAAREQASADDVIEDASHEQNNDDNESDDEGQTTLPIVEDAYESDDDDEDHGELPLPRLRRNRSPSYRHLKGRAGDGSLPTVARPREFGGRHQSHVILQSIILTQYNLKQGIKKFGDVGEAAVLTELQQPYDRDVMKPVGKFDLTAEERKGALRYRMFLKEKRCGTIKGHGCADGRKQRDYMTKQETSAPTVATEALFSPA
jgi:hypothetical protein